MAEPLGGDARITAEAGASRFVAHAWIGVERPKHWTRAIETRERTGAIITREDTFRQALGDVIHGQRCWEWGTLGVTASTVQQRCCHAGSCSWASRQERTKSGRSRRRS